MKIREYRTSSICMLGVLLLLSACTTGTKWRFRVVAAKASLRKIEAAESAFKSAKGKYGTLQELAAADLVKGDLANGIGDGYRFEVRAREDTYEALAIPIKSIDQNLPAYYLDKSGVLRQSFEGTEANANDERAPET